MRKNRIINVAFRLLLLFFLGVMMNVSLLAQNQDVAAGKVKAHLMETITRFVNWSNPYYSSQQTFIIKIIGETETLPFMEIAFQKANFNVPVKVIRIKSVKEIENCDILYIGEVNKTLLQEVLVYVRGKPILTVSENYGFAQAGVMINFFLNESKIAYEINVNSAKNSGFHIDFYVLEKAHEIYRK